MKDYYEVIAVSSGGEQLNFVGIKQRVRIYPVEMSRKITPYKDLQAVIKLFLFFRKEKPFIVHTHTPKAGAIGILAAWLAGVPNRLHTVAGLPLLEINGPKRILLDFIEKLTYSFATKVYPNSVGLQNIIIRNKYAQASKLKIIGKGSSNGINTSEFSNEAVKPEYKKMLKEKLKITDDNIVFCFIGRLVNDKGINELIKAFQFLYRQSPLVRLLIAGQFENELGPLSPETTEAIHNHNGIHFEGFQDDVRPYLSICDVFVFPSYREGFPNVVMQAGAMGKPSIVTDINGCNEIIIEGENGLIIPAKNTSALLDAMQKMMLHSELRLKMGKNARSMIVDRYEQNFIWYTLLNEYQQLEKAITTS